MKKVICSNEQLRCYPVGECPLKDRCMWYQAAQPGEVLEQLAQTEVLASEYAEQGGKA